MNIFLSRPRNPSRVCLLSGTRMAHEDALYLIGYFRLSTTLHQAGVKTGVPRVETLLCFLETSHSSSDPGMKEKSSFMWIVNLKTHMRTSQPETDQ